MVINPELDINSYIQIYQDEPLFGDYSLEMDPVCDTATHDMRSMVTDIDVLMNIKSLSKKRTTGNKLFTGYLRNLKNNPTFYNDYRALDGNKQKKYVVLKNAIEFFAKQTGAYFYWHHYDGSVSSMNIDTVIQRSADNIRRLAKK